MLYFLDYSMIIFIVDLLIALLNRYIGSLKYLTLT